MGLLDSLVKSGGLGAAADMVARNPGLMKAAASLLDPKDSSVGGSMGLLDVVSAFQSKGLDDIVGSWIGSGQNREVSAAEVESALGSDTIGQFAQKAGISASEAGVALAGMLPALIDQLTPEGKAPQASGLESMIGQLLR